jgi:hypothetical protein
MTPISVIILCGQSPRHLYFANQVCKVCNPKAIIHESGTVAPFKKALNLLTNQKNYGVRFLDGQGIANVMLEIKKPYFSFPTNRPN